MKPTAISIHTPVGRIDAPYHPDFVDKLARCRTKFDLFRLAERSAENEPDAFNEILARGLYDDYIVWRDQI